jgi:DNA-binding NarL/FixJ family response regulator
MTTLRVCLVEDDRRYRDTLELVLARAPGFRVVASHGSAEGLLATLAQDLPWDLVIMDLDLPGVDGTTAIARVRERHAGVPIVVLTGFDDPPRILDAIRAGADGYLLKTATPGELVACLRQAVAGGAPLDPGVARAVLDLLRHERPARVEPPPKDLTPRELDVLRALVDGLAYKQIADELGVSIDTVRSFVRSLYAKLGVHSATEAVSLALRRGWAR